MNRVQNAPKNRIKPGFLVQIPYFPTKIRVYAFFLVTHETLMPLLELVPLLADHAVVLAERAVQLGAGPLAGGEVCRQL